jgi:hypothetical protein
MLHQMSENSRATVLRKFPRRRLALFFLLIVPQHFGTQDFSPQGRAGIVDQ